MRITVCSPRQSLRASMTKPRSVFRESWYCWVRRTPLLKPLPVRMTIPIPSTKIRLDLRWAKAFFLNLNSNYQLKYEPAYSIKRGSLPEFYQTKYIWRKLLVESSNDSIRLVIELKEQRTDAPQTADYRIKYWMVGEGLEDLSADGTYKPDDLNVLQKLWVFLGLQINSFSTWTPAGNLSDLASLFSMASGNWNDAFSEPF